MTAFPPTLEAALARLDAVEPTRYARTRNALDGAVTRLSPYLTHGFLTLPQVLSSILDRHALDVQHKFVYELGWREYCRHVWQQRGADMLGSLHAGVLPDAAYAPEMPDDIRQARCGVPAIDRAVRELYHTGYLHNHARMWLASFVVHVRKVSWRAGADWMIAHLLDGDLASNHLSWQWVAGTASLKPYLFNADNVARYAPADWHSPGSVIDTSYEDLDRLARTPERRGGATASHGAGIAEPPVFAEPRQRGAGQPLDTLEPNETTVRGRHVWLVHSWNLRPPPSDLPADTLVIGLFDAEFHHRWPWSERRWNFVTTRMAALTPVSWFTELQSAARVLAVATSVRTVTNPHCPLPTEMRCQSLPEPTLFAAVDHPCSSFSQWWARATRGLKDARDLPGLTR